MASITIRRLEDSTKRRLARPRVAQRAFDGRRGSPDSEGCGDRKSCAWAETSLSRYASKFAPLGGVDLPEIPREPMRPPPRFD